MKLYFNGCSHTWGDDLNDPATQSWPAVLSCRLNCEFLNDSISGGTNDRIVYRTIKNIQNFDKFYIAWTHTSRFTQYRSDNNHDVNFNVQLHHRLYGNDPDFKNYGTIHYRTWHNELYSFKLWLQKIILLQAFFKTNNKDYVMVNSVDNFINRWSSNWQNFNNSVKSLLCFDSMNDEQLRSESDEIQALLKQIDYSKFISWGKWHLTSLIGCYSVGPTGHLLEDGHAAIADYIFNHDSL